LLRNLFFFIDHQFHLSECLANTSWLQKLAYLTDSFTGHNELNLSSQGKMSIFTSKWTAPLSNFIVLRLT